ncbi:MAG: hypothetical protein M1814_000846 [Vezdaea aestivalis]|nr:MAG: hypothetical protein M1814_000846 [Vezdaea aestivalis]
MPKGTEILERESRELQEVDLNSNEALARPDLDILEVSVQIQSLPRRKIRTPREGNVESIEAERHTAIEAQQPHHPRQVFQKLVENFRRKSLQRSRTVPARRREAIEEEDSTMDTFVRQPKHEKSSSLNSMAFVTTMKTASMSLASLSLPAPSKVPGRSSRLRSGTRSSRPSGTEARSSMDSRATGPVPLLNGGVWDRAVKRRNILDELVTSEESYIADLKVLVNVYFTLLSSVPNLSQNIRASIRQNVMDIIQLHESLLSDMMAIVPGYNERQRHVHRRSRFRVRTRSQSLDLSSSSSDGFNASTHARKSMDVVHPAARHGGSFTAEPKVALGVAKIFERLMSRFFAYEEYGAKYQDLVRETAAAHASIPAWRHYEKGIEALANSLASQNNRSAQARKGLQFGDLLIKPIQRVCKYPLLFEDLFKETPVYDCPESHAELEKVLYRLRETVREINRATDDPVTRNRIERTWLLQDKLTFPEQVSKMDDQLIRSTMRYRLLTQPPLSQANTIRLLGHVLLCGALHVAWQGPEVVQGQYLLCILFKSVILIASASKADQKFQILAGMKLADTKMDSTTNGRGAVFDKFIPAVANEVPGLQCYNALYSWKLVFEMDNRLYEMIFSACSRKEETEWRSRIQDRCRIESMNSYDRRSGVHIMFPVLALNMTPMASLSGQPGSVARSISVHQATAESPSADTNQVVIRNTHALKEAQHPSDNNSTSGPNSPAKSVSRSQSLLSTNRIPLLTPRRSERVRLEASAADLWSRDIIPFPGMSVRKGEHLIRASASSVMRKLSMASIAKRSQSFGSLAQTPRADETNAGNGVSDGHHRKGDEQKQGRSRGYSSLRKRGDKVLMGFSTLPSPLPERRSSAGFRAAVTVGGDGSSIAESGQANQSLNEEGGRLKFKNGESDGDLGRESVKKRWSGPAGLVRGWVVRKFT